MHEVVDLMPPGYKPYQSDGIRCDCGEWISLPGFKEEATCDKCGQDWAIIWETAFGEQYTPPDANLNNKDGKGA